MAKPLIMLRMSKILYSISRRQSRGSVLVYALIILFGAFLISMFFMVAREDPHEIYKKNSNMRVEVLNGCGVNRLAIRISNVLRREGFNVVKIGNTQTQNFQKTIAIERSDEGMKNVTYFAKRIGCKNIGKDIDPALYLEVSLIIGTDYKEIFPDVEKEF